MFRLIAVGEIDVDISIIIVNWNSKKYLNNCLNSIVDTMYGISYETIVIDNNSSDGSVAYIKELYPDLTVIQNKNNIGFAKANNQGARYAKGKYLLFLNPDTIVKENAIGLLYACIEKYNYGAVGPKLVSENGNVQLVCARKFPSLTGTFYNMFLLERIFSRSKVFGKNLMGYWDHQDSRKVDSLSGACIMMRKKTFEEIGGFDEDYIFYGEEIDLCFKIHKIGERIFYCSNAEVMHYGGGSSKTANEEEVFYGIILFSSKRLFFFKNAGIIAFLVFNFICICASVFRLMSILFMGPFFGFKSSSDYNAANLYKYVQIFLISLGITKSRKYESDFRKVTVKKLVNFLKGT